MNNAKLTPAVIILTFAVLALLGPVEKLQDVTSDQVASRAYWLDILAALIGSTALAVKAVVVLVAGTFGIPIIRSANSSTTQIVPTPTLPAEPPTAAKP